MPKLVNRQKEKEKRYFEKLTGKSSIPLRSISESPKWWLPLLKLALILPSGLFQHRIGFCPQSYLSLLCVCEWGGG